jgi:hypothetical protein
MKLRVIFLAVSAIISTAGNANACDGVSFFRYANGRCINLTSISWLGRAEARQADINREEIPFRISVGEPTPVKGMKYLYQVPITVTNVSKNTTLDGATIIVTAPDGSKWSPRVDALNPGESSAVETLFFERKGNQNITSGEFKSSYDPKKSRNWKGIGELFRDRNESLDRSYPYNIKKEVTVCLVDYCPRGMARTDR